jgi:hypothetical protein
MMEELMTRETLSGGHGHFAEISVNTALNQQRD